MKFSQNIGIIHFIGIGGIGMSAIATVLHDIGYQVQGSDIALNANVERLMKSGIKIFQGHQAQNVDKAQIIVFSSAIAKDNPEYLAARKLNLPVVRRAEMLAELMRFKSSIAIAGTHGKTTTTSIIGCLLEEAGYDPTIINGGIINAFGSNTRIGKSEWLVTEADESDGSFTRLPAEIAVVTNIDHEHIDHYTDFDHCKKDYQSFVNNVPFYGFAVMCIDHPVIQQIYAALVDKKIITYGFSAQADYYIRDCRASEKGMNFTIRYQKRLQQQVELGEFFLPMHGDHNVLNATAALALGLHIGIKKDVIHKSLAQFKGVKRRFTHVADVAGVSIYDDYAHHPVELKAVLKATKKIADARKGRIIVIMQPHRFSRLAGLFNDFCHSCNEADLVFTIPVHSAGEKPLKDCDHKTLAKAMAERGHRYVRAIGDEKNITTEKIAKAVEDKMKKNDIIIFLGAGSVTKYAYEFSAYLLNRAKRVGNSKGRASCE